jgi:general secretion pathway protein J
MARATSLTSRSPRGFTLIELLVAISVMALLSLVSWRGLEAMSRATTQNQQRADAVLTLQTTLAQWGADLDAVTTLAQTRPIDWDGRVLRLTRRGSDASAPSVLVVAWTLKQGPDGVYWRRWQSLPFTTRGEWQQAWNLAAAWSQDGGAARAARARPAATATSCWCPPAAGNSTSSARTPGCRPASCPRRGHAQQPAGPVVAMPDGVRLVITLPPGDGLSGTLTRDWVRPTVGAPRTS